MRKKKIIITTNFPCQSGYYKYHFSFAKALQKLGYDVLFIGASFQEFINKFPNVKNSFLIVATTGEYFKYYIKQYGSNNVVFSTFYELFGSVPVWGDYIEDDLLMITPTRWSQKCLQKTFREADINVVASPYFVEEVSYYEKSKKDKVIFYFIGTNIKRKNLDILIESFLRYFAYREDVELLIHSINQSAKAKSIKQIINDCKRSLGYMNYKFTNVPLIKLNFSRLSSSREVHGCGDILVALSTGEGYHLPSMEALANGNFLITTNLGFVWPEIATLEEKDGYCIASYEGVPVGIVIECNRLSYIDSDDFYHSGFSRTLTFETDALFRAYQEAFYLYKYNKNQRYYADLNEYLLENFEIQFKNLLIKHEARQ